ncbi:unnamed protein product [Vitrella brassicaformis CCMP3155]|uniref:Uncharacterized protein n=1 Tax=Vitrella brassicaformis (strain CCMP3155) TaxID=1169540 RepID=A0A0G4FUD4_VITBC|nr:unnamed protein product [Vitrella brassicaformis CCMP3155]|eukprot:CEM18111.1 unnamed protein product [Vitrella brassicaformis CCMP3155]
MTPDSGRICDDVPFDDSYIVGELARYEEVPPFWPKLRELDASMMSAKASLSSRPLWPYVSHFLHSLKTLPNLVSLTCANCGLWGSLDCGAFVIYDFDKIMARATLIRNEIPFNLNERAGPYAAELTSRLRELSSITPLAQFHIWDWQLLRPCSPSTVSSVS